MSDTKISAELPFGIDSCGEIAKKSIEGTKKEYDKLYQIDVGIKSTMAGSIGARGLYNYDDMVDYKEFADEFKRTEIYYGSACTCQQYRNAGDDFKKGFCDMCACKNAVECFYKMAINEKMVIRQIIKVTYNTHGPNVLCGIGMTNYGKYISWTKGESNGHGYHPTFLVNEFREYNFWIPTDYINIMKILFCEKSKIMLGTYDGSGLHKHRMLMITHNVLDYIKNFTCDRKLVPLYAGDIVVENNKLADKFLAYEAGIKHLQEEKNKLEHDKEHFYKNEKPYLDLIKEKNELDRLRGKLQNIAKNLKMQKLQIEHDQLQIEHDQLMLKDVDLEGFVI